MKKKVLYVILTMFILAIAIIGSTYAYWIATSNSNSKDIKTKSTTYNISLNIDPLYNDFAIIPMNNNDALKALNNKCKDKYDRGACSAYYLDVYDYNKDLEYISSYMEVSTDNIQNLSYMVLRLSDNYSEDSCIKVGENDDIYCITKDATAVEIGAKLSLGDDNYSVVGMESTRFILVMWLSNLNYSQNDIDIGSFNASITVQANNGGEIKGSISNAIKIDNTVGDTND